MRDWHNLQPRLAKWYFVCWSREFRFVVCPSLHRKESKHISFSNPRWGTEMRPQAEEQQGSLQPTFWGNDQGNCFLHSNEVTEATTNTFSTYHGISAIKSLKENCMIKSKIHLGMSQSFGSINLIKRERELRFMGILFPRNLTQISFCDHAKWSKRIGRDLKLGNTHSRHFLNPTPTLIPE